MSELKDNSIILLQSFDNPVTAHIFKAKLESAEIPCFLKDEHTIGMNALYSQVLGGVKLMIFSRDLEKCRALLAEDSSLESEFGHTDYTDDAACPHCRSTDVTYGNATKKRFGWFTIIVSIALLIYPFYNRKAWHCYNCGEEF